MITLPANAQKRKKGKADTETVEWRYEMESVGVGSQGSAQLKVWSYSKFPETAKEQSKKTPSTVFVFADTKVTGECKARRRW